MTSLYLVRSEDGQYLTPGTRSWVSRKRHPLKVLADKKATIVEEEKALSLFHTTASIRELKNDSRLTGWEAVPVCLCSK